MRPSLRVAFLEVERKFCSLAVKDLASNTGQPAFKSIRALAQKTIHDVYFDNPSRSLISTGIWVRQRNGFWEAKVNLKGGGDYINSMFEELAGTEPVRRCVMDVIGKDCEKEHFGLEAVATLSTVRQSWIADDDFKIVFDTMNFGHTVGEVELQEEGQFTATANLPIEQQKRERMKEMDKRIEVFMDRYSWAFHLGVPKGKLTAYFELHPFMGKTQ
jgi:thiamine-triphosphatase